MASPGRGTARPAVCTVDALDRPPVVLDVGTGYIKAGVAGEQAPRLVTPSVVGYPAAAAAATAAAGPGPAGRRRGGGAPASDSLLADLDYVIGDAALTSPAYAVSYPLKHGIVVDWEGAERLYSAAIYRHLRLLPQDQPFILTEPPLNPPENREALAEMMFETLGVPGLHIGIQAVLALYASFAAAEARSADKGGSLTGVVVDSGDGCTHVIPVSEGFVLGSSIQSIPVAGRDVTTYIQQLLRDRNEPVPPEQSLEAARAIKERFCYCCADPAKEESKYAEPRSDKYWRRYEGGGGSGDGGGEQAKRQKLFDIAVGPERYLGPEVFFQPGLLPGGAQRMALPAMIDSVVQSCPIDTRRALYGNVVLSGGSTLFKDFGRRIQRDVKAAVEGRTAGAAAGVDVNVVSHPLQRYAVWFGGSLLGVSPGFRSLLVTKADYEEHGPGVVRGNAVYRDW